jgi:glycosyltransferase involved in cell wall biosynthesis
MVPLQAMLPITIWMNMPSFYQEDLFRALVATGEVDLQVIYARKLPPDRQQLGWHSDLSGYRSIFLSSATVTDYTSILNAVKLARLHHNHLHIVNGIWAEPAFAAAMAVFAVTGSRYAIYSEAVNPNRKHSIIKRTLRLTFGRLIVRRATGILPVAKLGEKFYQSLGAKDEQIYPFGYFRGEPLVNQAYQAAEKEKIELIFVGQLIRRKGVDLVLEAIAPLVSEHKHLTFTIVGDGEWRGYLQNQTYSMGLDKHVHFSGVLRADQIPARIQQADVLVLPSRWDGWGLVVNEALSVGVPVIVSNKCGASDLIRSGNNGYVFESENVVDLRDKLLDFLQRKSEWNSFSLNAFETGKKVSAERVAGYLITCLQHMVDDTNLRPEPPWHC